MKSLLIAIVLALPILGLGQVTVVQAPVPKFRSFLPSGSPNVGGCVYTFASGTSTPQATYVDFNGITANSNPIILDANGEAPIWITGVTYRFQVWSFGSGVIGSNCGNGTQLYQIDGVRDTGLNALNGPITIAPTSNGIDIFDLIRATDVSASGNFVNFKSFAGATLFKVDINGNMTAASLTPSSISAGDGTAAAPSYAFTSQLSTGIFKPGGGAIGFSLAGAEVFLLGSGGARLGSGFPLGFTSTADPAGANNDTAISRIAGATIAVGNGTQGDASGTIKDTITNALTGYQINGTATAGHCLVGNGTNYVDGNCTPAAIMWGYCQGVATASSTLYFVNLGAVAFTCTSTQFAGSIPIPTARTAKNLRVVCGTAGVNASSGAVTVFKNLVASALTCTVGTGTSCSDLVDTVLFAAGDQILVQFTTQAAETLGGCRVGFEMQ